MADRWYTDTMTAKKKTKKKHTKRTAGKKLKPIKKALKAKLAKKAASKKAGAKTKAGGRKKPAGKTARAAKKQVRGKSQTVDTVAFAPEGLGPRSSGQSGDLQGLANLEAADSESVDELLEEGNAFEADAVKHVQDAPDATLKQLPTHETPHPVLPAHTP